MLRQKDDAAVTITAERQSLIAKLRPMPEKDA